MAKRKTNTGIPGLSFSAKRAFGVTSAKRTIASKTGIPTTKSGMQRKVGRAVTGGGCLVPFVFLLMSVMAIPLFLLLS